MYRYLKKLTFTRRETASKWCHARKTRRCGGALSLLLALVFATAMLLHTSVARAVDIFKADAAVYHPLCQLSIGPSNDVFMLPELGGSFTFTPTGSFMEGRSTGAARLTGVITGGGNKFAVDLLLDGRLDEGDDGYQLAKDNAVFLIRAECLPDPLGWHFYTSLTGTLTGTGADSFNGAVYNVTLRGNPQVGFGANTHNDMLGAFAEIFFELDDPAAFPLHPVGPFWGEMGMNIIMLNLLGYALYYNVGDNFPTASPDIMGTWVGVIDCAGMSDFTDAETFSDPMTLKVGPVVGRYYSAKLYNAQNVLVASFCVTYLNDLRGGQINTGFMFKSDDPDRSMVLLKVKDDSGTVTLKAREIIDIPDGLDADGWPDGLEVCKWSFTQEKNPVDPVIGNVCVDMDGDGVLFEFDKCLGFDDNADFNANGIPDCFENCNDYGDVNKNGVPDCYEP